MFTLKINPLVLHKLRVAYPSPPNCAEKALEKYRVLLEGLIFKAMQRGRDAYDMKMNTYSIPLSVLSHEGPQLGSGQRRLHAWLRDNDLQLVRILEEGSNFTGLVSKVKLTELVTIDSNATGLAASLSAATTDADIDGLLCGDMADNAALFGKLYPDYFKFLTLQQRDAVFDVAPIDIKSLQAYIVWLNTRAKKFSPETIRSATEQAMTILSVAKYTDGYFPMRKKLSEFGRTYYAGLSVQNVDKTLRRAMLGDCWEYDIRSAVIAWKLGFAKELAQQRDPNKSYQRQFWASDLYVTGRKEFMRDVRAEAFGKDSEYTIEFQDSLIKQAVTAIGFGARAQSNGWRASNGEWANPSLVKILTNQRERDRFLACPIITQFIEEQQALDIYLESGMKNDLPEIYHGPLVTANVKPSRSKAVAFLYQHQETMAMDVARTVLAKHVIKPIANIHDAFIVKRKLSVDVHQEIIYEMQTQMQNPYFSIKSDRLEGFVLQEDASRNS